MHDIGRLSRNIIISLETLRSRQYFEREKMSLKREESTRTRTQTICRRR